MPDKSPPLNSKLPDVGTTIFTVMSQLAEDAGALNLSQGFPDFAAPPALLDRVRHHLEAGHNQYAPMAGAPVLRETVATKIHECYGWLPNPDTEITITSGATEALFSAIEALVHPGDEVIVFDPAYDSYDPAIRLAGGTAIHLPLERPDFRPDWSAVADALTPRTRMVIINSPHNPTGAVLTSEDMAQLAELLRDTDTLVLSDEVYEHIIFDGRRHESVLRYPELRERSIAVSSFGKTFHTTGWKIGYCAGPAALMNEFRRVHQFVQFCVATPLQLALADYLDSDPSHWRSLPAFYEEKRDRICHLLSDSRLAVSPSAGTYFQLIDYSAITDEPDVSYARRLTLDHGLAAIPVSVFYAEPPDQQLLRLCFAKDDGTLVQAGEILCAL